MILSFWRRAHLLLALIASIFLLITSITGVILSFEPISNELSPYHLDDGASISVGDLIHTLEKTYSEVIELKIENNEFLELSVITNDGDFQSFYANPKTGEKIGEIQEESSLFSFTRSIHRSLFLGDIGRATIGITSFLLLFIALSGVLLIIKRQLTITRFFGKVSFEHFYHYWHIILGRLFVPIIAIIALTGTFLSMDRFGLLPEKATIKHSINYDQLVESPQLPKHNFSVFKNTKLSELKKLEFPFSPDPEDYFLLQLKDAELIVNQFNGEIISSQNLGSMSLLQQLNFNLHTGQGSILWAIILCFACLSILFFIISGFKITLKRLQGKRKNSLSKDICTIIILVGSEGGNTARIANKFHQLLLKAGQQVYLDELDHYETYPNLEQLIILTSTYGNGEAPASARKFIDKLNTVQQKKDFTFSVVGFGSMDYPHFCQYAEDVNRALSKIPRGKSILPLVKINNGSVSSFNTWIKRWSNTTEIHLKGSIEEGHVHSNIKTDSFELLNKTEPTEHTNFTYLLTFRNIKNTVKSGDLIAISPPNSNAERFYSIGKTPDGNLLLSIRKHSEGICSTYLSQLAIGSSIKARIQTNPKFHFPVNTTKVLGICNGTGIAPFLGMATENSNGNEFQIFWGGKSTSVFNVFEPYIHELLSSGKINSFHPVFSADNTTESRYVQTLIADKQEEIAQLLDSHGILMICGSLTMRDGVLSTIDKLTRVHNNEPITYYEKRGQIKTDCY